MPTAISPAMLMALSTADAQYSPRLAGASSGTWSSRDIAYAATIRPMIWSMANSMATRAVEVNK